MKKPKLPFKKLSVGVDKEEKQPYLFPGRLTLRLDYTELLAGLPAAAVDAEASAVSIPVETVRTSLRRYGADYLLLGYEHVSRWERKGRIEELVQNVATKDSVRFSNSLLKLVAGCRYPYLVLDMLPSGIWRPEVDILRTLDVGWILDRLLGMMAFSNLRLMWGSRRSPKPAVRRRLGEIILRVMAHHVIADHLKGDL